MLSFKILVLKKNKHKYRKNKLAVNKRKQIQLCILYIYKSLMRSTQNYGFSCGAMIKNQPANAGDTRDVGLIPGS